MGNLQLSHIDALARASHPTSKYCVLSKEQITQCVRTRTTHRVKRLSEKYIHVRLSQICTCFLGEGNETIRTNSKEKCDNCATRAFSLISTLYTHTHSHSLMQVLLRLKLITLTRESFAKNHTQ